MKRQTVWRKRIIVVSISLLLLLAPLSYAQQKVSKPTPLEQEPSHRREPGEFGIEECTNAGAQK